MPIFMGLNFYDSASWRDVARLILQVDFQHARIIAVRKLRRKFQTYVMRFLKDTGQIESRSKILPSAAELPRPAVPFGVNHRCFVCFTQLVSLHFSIAATVIFLISSRKTVLTPGPDNPGSPSGLKTK